MTTTMTEKAKADDPIVSLSEIARQIGKSYMTVKGWGVSGLIELERSGSESGAARVLGVRLKEINRFLSGSKIKVKVKPPAGES